MKKLLLLITMLIPMLANGQTYDALWSQVNKAVDDDLPQTEQQALQKIVKKAEKERNYGQLLKAELQMARSMVSVSSDSLAPSVERLKEQEQASQNDPVMSAVLQCVLGYIYQNNRQLSNNYLSISQGYYTKALSNPEALAQARAKDWVPFVVTDDHSYIYGDDLLSIIAYEAQRFDVLRDFYMNADGAKNRTALMMASLEVLRQQRPEEVEKLKDSKYLASLDSLISLYSDLPETAEVVIERYRYMNMYTDATTEQKWNYLVEAQQRWGGWKRINELFNAQKRLEQKQFTMIAERTVGLPGQELGIELKNLRGLSSISLRLYRVNAKGNIDYRPNSEYDYKHIKPLLQDTGIKLERTYSGKKAYELYEDSLTLQGLEPGVYMIEMESQPKTDVERAFYFVSNIRTVALPLPDYKMRYAVVNATTGHPVKGAKIQLYGGWRGDEALATLTTDDKGEAIYNVNRDSDRRPRSAFSTTDDDAYCPPLYGSGSYSYYGTENEVTNINVYTDRAIYRPGQTVHAGAIIYKTTQGYINQVVKQKKVRMTLRDANYKTVAETYVTTDDHGTCSTDFILPTQLLTGRFTVIVDGSSHSIRVEEYKRPTFEVEFPEVTQNYADGDTLPVKAIARSYAGVPVQGASVKYTVERRHAYWWISYSSFWGQGVYGTGSDDEVLAEGETMTDDDGSFTVDLPLTVPKTRYPMFYNFVVKADVTDQAGETHQAEIALPLGNRKTALSIDVAEKVLVEEGGKVTFHLLNAAGNDIDTNVKYKIEKIPAAGNATNVRWITTKTNTPVALEKMASGRYRITAQPANTTDDMEPAEREFIVFSLDDKRPAIETDDWFYIHKRQFPNTGAPVTYQVGSSDKDVHVFYAITAADQLLESGTVNLTNELVNRKLNYKEEYGNGVLIAYAWVKNGKAYHHEATVKRPVPDVLMKMKWESFRNRLTPGQQEEWTLTITHPDGTPANNAQLMATLYDKSLDQIASHDWSLVPHQYLPQPYTRWLMQAWSGFSLNGSARAESRYVPDFRLNHFDHEVYPSYYYASNMLFKKMRMRGDIVEEAPMMLGAAAGATMDFAERKVEEESAADTDEGSMKKDDAQPQEQQEQLQMRENLQETAFFYPQLMADSTGRVAIKFTLPESLTTWRFLSVAHTQDMMYATMQDEAVAQKDVMIQPNMPRFVRHGDNSTISARVFNTSQQAQNGTARLQLIDPETEKVVYDEKQLVSIAAGGTSGVSFIVPCSQFDQSLLIAKMMVSGATFSDGEQHYLPILPDKERVTVTVPFTQNEPGTKTIDLSALVPNNATQGKLTVEYTNNPAWLMIQALPSVGHPYDDCAICQATSFYANALGRHILNQNPQAKDVFEMWTRETGQETTLMSNLQKNQELKDLVLNETPWVRDADREVQQKQLLADFFDKNLMSNRINQAVEKLKKLQRGDGSWSWWPDMPGSFYMTLEVSEMLVRLNQMAGMQKETENMLQNAIDYLGDDIVEMVKQMKKYEKKGYKQSFPSNMALQWLYICAIDGRDLPSKVKSANEYLIKLLKKENKRLSIYGKSMAAIILNDKTYIKSLKEYTVYREDIGRYYDTGRALYSWFDYRIPTQVAAIEALQRLSPDDSITIDEMRRWLLQSKRTQAWDTPINSVNATYAFMNNRPEVLKAQPKTSLRIDGSELEMPQATAGLGYIKTAVPIQGQKTIEAEKTSTGTSWGAVYAQFMQPSSEITDLQSGITVTREILVGNDLSPLTSGTASLKVGDRIKVRLTIVADRDYDFVQVVDKRAACMEPVSQRSGYQWREGYYYAPKDCSTNFYFDMLRKGKHVITTEYYIDREGTYETGTCSAQCAYSPEFRGTTKSVTLRVEK